MKRRAPRGWYTIRASSEDAEVLIYDEIGSGWFTEGVTAQQFIDDVRALNLKPRNTLTVRINSPGGDVFDGIAIYNFLRGARFNVRALIDGVAASAASVIAMAGDPVEMPENAFLMIHMPWTVAIGNADALRTSADRLDKIGESVALAYQRKAGPQLAAADLDQMLRDETWLTAADAVRLGLADRELTDMKAVASIDLSRYPFKAIPTALREPRFALDVQAERARLARMTSGARTQE